jgi:hypothetical protein
MFPAVGPPASRSGRSQLDALEASGLDIAAARDAATDTVQGGQNYAVAAARVHEYVTTHCGADAGRDG